MTGSIGVPSAGFQQEETDVKDTSVLGVWPVWEWGGSIVFQEHPPPPPHRTVRQVLFSGLFADCVALKFFLVLFDFSNSSEIFTGGLWCPTATQGARAGGGGARAAGGAG